MQRKRGGRAPRVLQDKQGCFDFLDASVIDEFLCVAKCHKSMPNTDAVALHGTSVQHPAHPQYRWLLYSRRVPYKSCNLRDVSLDRPDCAGIGSEDSLGRICRSCQDALCVSQLGLHKRALANLMWGGRDHPTHQHLTDAMRMLLNRGYPYLRQVAFG